MTKLERDSTKVSHEIPIQDEQRSLTEQEIVFGDEVAREELGPNQHAAPPSKQDIALEPNTERASRTQEEDLPDISRGLEPLMKLEQI
jgi:hypothetical protein